MGTGCREPGHRYLTKAEGSCTAALPWRKGIQPDELAWRRGMEGPHQGTEVGPEHNVGSGQLFVLLECEKAKRRQESESPVYRVIERQKREPSKQPSLVSCTTALKTHQ